VPTVVYVLLACAAVAGVGASCGSGTAPTFTNINNQVLQVSCTTTSCHYSGATPAVGLLDLKTAPYLALLGPNGTGAPAVNPECYPYTYPNMVLVKPGEPSESLMYLKVSGEGAGAPNCIQGPSGCTPCDQPPVCGQPACGNANSCCPYGQEMPYSTCPLPTSSIQLIHDWIAAGAANN
jgi:hypothetical protein